MNGIQKLLLSLIYALILVSCTETKEKQKPADVPSGEEPIFVDADAGKTWKIFGLEIVGKIMSEQTNGQYAVIRSTTPPKGGPPTHVHQHEDELFYVLDGEFEFRCGEEKFTLSKGGMIVLPRKLPHSFRNIGDKPGVLMNTITPGGFEEFFAEIDRLPKDKPLERQEVEAIASKYGLSFLPEARKH